MRPVLYDLHHRRCWLSCGVVVRIGSQVQKPLAVVVVGGMMLAPILILVTLPALILMFSRRRVGHTSIALCSVAIRMMPPPIGGRWRGLVPLLIEPLR